MYVYTTYKKMVNLINKIFIKKQTKPIKIIFIYIKFKIMHTQEKQKNNFHKFRVTFSSERKE